MKRVLLALLCVACTGIASAQERIPQSVPQGPALELVSGRLLAGPACCNSSCPPACAQPCKSAPCKTSCPACVAVPAKKITIKVEYSSACEKICYKACPSILGGGCNTGCDQGSCGTRTYPQKYLVKKVSATVCDTYKCVPTNPSCDSCRTGILHNQCSQAPACVETVPVQPKKK